VTCIAGQASYQAATKVNAQIASKVTKSGGPS